MTTQPTTGKRHRLTRLPRTAATLAVLGLVTLLVGTPAGAHERPPKDAEVAVRFVDDRHPADAEKGTTITSTPFNPTGPPVKVEVVSADGDRVKSADHKITVALLANPSGGTLAGTTTQRTVQGVAVFDDLDVDLAGVGYTLQATSDELGPATSDPFTIYDDTCGAGETCAATAGDLAQDGLLASSTGVGGPGSGGLIVAVGDTSPVCAGDHSRIPETVTVFSTNLTDSIVEFRVPKAVDQEQPNNGVAHYEVCAEPLDEDSEFVDRDGDLVEVGEAGLLPMCGPPSRTAEPPCVIKKKKTRGADVLITVRWGSHFKMR